MILLKEYIKLILQEKAKGLSDAQTNNLALFNSDAHILYSTEQALQGFKAIAQKSQADENYDANDEVNEVLFKAMRGYIKIAQSAYPANGADTVREVAAVDGYGPLMYDIAMSKHNNGIIPDRKTVQPGAERVYQVYQKTKAGPSGAVTAKPLDDIDNPKTPDKSDDAPIYQGRDALNYSYNIQSPINVGGLETAHQSFLKNAQEVLGPIGYNAKTIERRIGVVGQQFFDIKFGNG